MKLMICLCLLALAACRNQPERNKPFVRQVDTVWTGADGKEPITIESLPGIDAPVVIDGDTVYTNVDTPPVFSAGDLEDYLSEMVKDIHIGKGVPVVTFVVNKSGFPCHVTLRRSAKVFSPDVRTAHRMDSIACELVRGLPYFIPANLNGKPVCRRMVVAVKFN